MFFRDIIGQSETKQRLIRSVKESRISHAQLFFGPRGSGKLPLAIAYARYILCLDRGEDDACGTCSSCVKISKLIHPDLHFSFPVVKKGGSETTTSDLYMTQFREAVIANPYLSEEQWYAAIDAENKQGLIPRTESGRVLSRLSLKAYEGEYKILVIWLAEKMHVAAANALLKVIEEPPDKTLFILVSENTDDILPTILSRTQLIRFSPVSNENVREALLSRYPEAQERVDDVVRRSNGDFGLALQTMASEDEAQVFFDDFIFLMRRCYAREIIEIIGWIDKFAGFGREKQKDFLEYCLRMIRENFILNLGQDSLNYMSKKEHEFSVKFSAFIHPGNASQMAAEFEQAISHIEANGYSKLVMLDLSVKVILLLKKAVEAANA